MNILKREYRVFYNKKTDHFEESEIGSMPVIEFESAGITQRVITVSNINDLLNQVFKSVIRHQILVNEMWVTSSKNEVPTASKNTFVDAETGESVPKSESYEYVDDLDDEIMDVSSSKKPVSFDPPRYKKKAKLKDGVAVESDSIIKQFSPALFPFYSNSMKTRYKILDGK